MNIFLRYIYSFLQLAIFILSLFTVTYGPLVIALNIVLLIMTLDKMGKGIVWRESCAIIYAVTCLLMPLIGYSYYTINNQMAKTWVRYMPIPENVYFDFALPAISIFCFALTLPLGIRKFADEGVTLKDTIGRIKNQLRTQKNLGIQIMIVGILSGAITNKLPGALQFISTLFFFASFAGLLLVYFAPDFKRKKLLIASFLLFIMYSALSSGMFTIVAYMGITLYSFFLLKSNPSIFRKIIIFLFAMVFIIVLQNTKIAFRQYTWHSNYSGSKVELFSKIFFENIQKGDVLIEKNTFFIIYVRANQGYNVGLVMRRIPSFQRHDNGTNLLTAFASAFVPRVLWPDKPEAGGKFNMKYYAGWEIRGWSTNIGPLGEAYGAFGVSGGILYMLVLGFVIRWAFWYVFKIARKRPIILCWLPVIFFQIVSSAETDSLQIFNSLMKVAVFLWLLNKFLPHWLGKLPDQKNRSNQPSSLRTTVVQADNIG